MLMGCHFSTRVKAESPTHNGLDPKVVGKEEDTLNGLRSKPSSSHVLLTSRNEGKLLQFNNLKCFTFNELKTATRNFRPSSLVGVDGLGFVYKGRVDEHTLAPAKPGTGFAITVNVLNQESNQGHAEWLAKINYLAQLCHPNLVKLIGYCLKDNYRILVYEFSTKGSLDHHLFRRVFNLDPLSWKIRMKIALGAAKGLAFLHSDEVELIYGDFKTSNILIDSNYNAKLSIFELRNDRSEDDMIDLKRVNTGPKIYAAPEYLATGRITKKSDVYSYGVVLLEIISGKRALDDNRPFAYQNLVEWAKPLLIRKHKISQVMDFHIEGQYSQHEATKLAHIVIQCLSERPENRPNIDEVVRSLEQLQES